MPVRSLSSAVFKWPDRETVLAAARRWASGLRAEDSNVEFLACIGSYARGDWGVGSDLDLVLVITNSVLPWAMRSARYEPRGIPVPVDLWVYTRAEWEQLSTHSPHRWRCLGREMVDLMENRES